jgi:putative intracellular protease/amidase
VIAAVCHAPEIFHHIKIANAEPMVSGRNVTGFANSEEATAGLTDAVTFLA